MSKLLITYGTRPLAQRVSKLVMPTLDVLFASAEDIPSLLLQQNYRKIPTYANPTFAHELLKLAIDEEIRYILPLSSAEQAALQEARILFAEYGVQLLTPEDLSSVFYLSNPPAHLPLMLIHHGLDLVGQHAVAETSFSGLALLSDSGEEPAICII